MRHPVRPSPAERTLLLQMDPMAAIEDRFWNLSLLEREVAIEVTYNQEGLRNVLQKVLMGECLVDGVEKKQLAADLLLHWEKIPPVEKAMQIQSLHIGAYNERDGRKTPNTTLKPGERAALLRVENALKNLVDPAQTDVA